MRGRVPPAGVLGAVARALGAGTPDALELASLGGGCIHPAFRVRRRAPRSDGPTVAFLKWNPDPAASGFGGEARGLAALAAAGGPRIPRVIAWSDGPPHGWLLLEYVEPGPTLPETATLLGAGLARLHRPVPGGAAGWEEDGWIGPLPQANGPRASWPDFWREARLRPQWERARGRFPRRTHDRWERLLVRLDEALRGWEADGISLLHGDLWSGNVLVDGDGAPALVDPAVYRGHREVDLAMMELFGGFSGAVLGAYEEEAPLAPEYGAIRRDVYQLYPLLVHVNLFGSGYVPGAVERVERILAELG